MIRLIRKLYGLAGEKRRDLRAAALLQALEAMCESGVYLIIFRTVASLLQGIWDQGALVRASLILLGLFAARCLLEYFVNRLQSAAGYDIIGRVRLSEAEKLRHLPMGRFLGESLGALLSAFTSDMAYAEMYCMSTVTRFTAGMAMVIVTTLMMLFVDLRMALIAVSGFLPALFVYRYARRLFERSGVLRQKTQQGAIGAVLEYASGMETIKTYRVGEGALDKVKNALAAHRDTSARYELMALNPMMLYQLCVRAGMGLIFVGGLALYAADAVTLNVYLFFLIISQKYYAPVEAIFLDYGVLNLMGIAFQRIDELGAYAPLPDKGKARVMGTDIAFRDVHFGYPGAKRDALRGLNAALLPNALNAIVGPSGSGKTTMLHMIARFWEASEGKLQIGGVPIASIAYAELMKSVSVVFQDVYLFADTLRENIRMGKPDATDLEILRAAKLAYLEDVIQNLPEGLDTPLGEGGNTLSGGEKQRVAIARAILKDAPIILLDEAFSSLDAENAWAIQRAVGNMTARKTVVMIAHTLSHIQNAARIVVVSDGRADACGTHAELMAGGGVYQRLWEREHAAKEWRLGAP